ncbi:MAG: Clp protease N-terminal domain-containing protein [Candidatus Nanopelagicales bacterium]
MREAIALHQRAIEVEHVVLGVTRDPNRLVVAIIETRMSVEDLRAAALASLADAA